MEAKTDVGMTYVYVNGELVKEYESIEMGEMKSIRFDRSIESEVEIRFLKEYTYVWESYDITTNQIPVELAYLKYDKDAKYVKFSLEGADIVHPNIIDTTKRSVEESLTEYTVLVDGEKTLTCYPKITTGSNVYFKCKCASYPHVIKINTTLGVSEKTTFGISVVNNQVEEEVKEVVKEEVVEEVKTETDNTKALAQEDTETQNISAPEETETLNNISMTDTIYENESMSRAVKFLTLMLFLAVITLLFVASHHKHENRQSGKLHPHKKRSKK
jgi:hypothetical protein